ncbi:MAG: D-cysteine desulfhydrase family protein [Pseudomonadales bacterium]|nr:D-cysteine desulfhydrase family protein [Pseudomonadales bacterium]
MSLKTFSPCTIGYFPTPVMPLLQLTQKLGGPELWMKRDDLTGLALGGNKTRKLAYILQEALDRHCDTVITAGAIQSNHCRQTAAAAAALGLECHLVLGGHAPETATGNLLLDQLFGANIHWAGQHRKGEDISALATALMQNGRKPCIVPYGGSNELGAYSFVQALEELETQLDTESLTHIVFASSSGGTHAGLMLGKALLQKNYQITGISIDKGETDEVPFDQHILRLANATSDYIGAGLRFSQDDLILNDQYLGEGYGVIGEPEIEAITLTARLEGILLDPVYTGRAMAGLIGMIRKGEIAAGDKVLFWHTGGAPALFAYADALQVHHA